MSEVFKAKTFKYLYFQRCGGRESKRRVPSRGVRICMFWKLFSSMNFTWENKSRSMNNLHGSCKVNHCIPLFHVQHLSLEVDETELTSAITFLAIHNHLSILKTWDHRIVFYKCHSFNWLHFKHNICVAPHLSKNNNKQTLKDGASFCYCACVLRILDWSENL